MQCPNCRKIEKGQWLFAKSSRSLADVSMDDWINEDVYDLSYSEMVLQSYNRFDWCPYSRITELFSSYNEEDYPSDSLVHDFVRQYTMFDPSAATSASNPCPYIAYMGPAHLSSSTSEGTILDTSSFNNHWNRPSGPGEEASASYAAAFPGMEVHYHNWEHRFLPSSFSSSSRTRSGGADQSSVPSVTHRQARSNSYMSRSGNLMHQYSMGNSSASTTGSSMESSMNPPHPGSVTRTRGRVQALQAYSQQRSNSPPLHAGRRPNAHREYSQVGPTALSAGRNALETESRRLSNHLNNSWEIENQILSPYSQANREPIWGPLPGRRHGLERTWSHNR